MFVATAAHRCETISLCIRRFISRLHPRY